VANALWKPTWRGMAQTWPHVECDASRAWTSRAWRRGSQAILLKLVPPVECDIRPRRPQSPPSSHCSTHRRLGVARERNLTTKQQKPGCREMPPREQPNHTCQRRHREQFGPASCARAFFPGHPSKRTWAHVEGAGAPSKRTWVHVEGAVAPFQAYVSTRGGCRGTLPSVRGYTWRVPGHPSKRT
jgi:hypothetical protein